MKRPEPKAFGVVAQVRSAMKPQTRIATLVGFALGGFVPLASYVVAHGELGDGAWLPYVFVFGGLVYSAMTVFSWGRVAFQNAYKAAGFVLLLEGVMIASHTSWLSIASLVYLIAINGIATGCNLSHRV